MLVSNFNPTPRPDGLGFNPSSPDDEFLDTINSGEFAGSGTTLVLIVLGLGLLLMK
mgnify:CR=1 FL=1